MESRRIQSLDVLRGIAILGTLGTNIWLFTSPRGPAGMFDLPAPDSVAGVTELLLRTLSNGKFLALLSIMFGIGLELQYRSARRNGRRWPGWYLWRSALLLVEGLLHYVLIFEFDVLMYYALVSVLVAFLVARSDRVARVWAITTASLHVVVVGALTALLLAAPAESGVTIAAAETDGSWWSQVRQRIDLAGEFRAEIVFALPLSTALFLFGVLLLRSGALTDSVAGQRIQTRLAKWGLGVGVPLNLLTSFAGPEWFLLDRYVCAPLVAFGLLGGITLLANRSRRSPGPFRVGLTSIGRTALSGYIAQNLIAGILCYRWGFGLAERFADARPWWVAGLFVVISVILAGLSTLWLRRFDRGPVELAMHRAYLAPQRVGAR